MAVSKRTGEDDNRCGCQGARRFSRIIASRGPPLVAKGSLDHARAEPRREVVEHDEPQLFFAPKMVVEVAPAHSARVDDIVERGRLKPVLVEQAGRRFQDTLAIATISSHRQPPEPPAHARGDLRRTVRPGLGLTRPSKS